MMHSHQGTWNAWNPFYPQDASSKWVGRGVFSVQQIWKLRFRAAQWLAQVQLVVHHFQLHGQKTEHAANPSDITSWPPSSCARKEQRIQVVEWDIVHLNGESTQESASGRQGTIHLPLSPSTLLFVRLATWITCQIFKLLPNVCLEWRSFKIIQVSVCYQRPSGKRGKVCNTLVPSERLV